MIDPLTIVSEFDSLRAEPTWAAQEAPECMGRVYMALTKLFEPYMTLKYPQVIVVAAIENQEGDVILYQGPAANPSRFMLIPKKFLGKPSEYRAQAPGGAK